MLPRISPCSLLSAPDSFLGAQKQCHFCSFYITYSEQITCFSLKILQKYDMATDLDIFFLCHKIIYCRMVQSGDFLPVSHTGSTNSLCRIKK